MLVSAYFLSGLKLILFYVYVASEPASVHLLCSRGNFTFAYFSELFSRIYTSLYRMTPLDGEWSERMSVLWENCCCEK